MPRLPRLQHDACGDNFCECNRDRYDIYGARDGRSGRDGRDGRHGKDGKDGPTGPTGPAQYGPIGATGSDGPTGPAGPTGPNGSQESTFINICRVSDIAVPQEMAVAYDVLIQKYGNVEYNVGGASVYIWQPGYYQLYYSLFPQQPAQFAVKLNDTIISGSIVGSSGGSSSIAGSIIFLITDNDFTQPTNFPTPTGFAALIQIVNHTSIVPIVILNGSNGSGLQTTQVRAMLTLNLIRGV